MGEEGGQESQKSGPGDAGRGRADPYAWAFFMSVAVLVIVLALVVLLRFKGDLLCIALPAAIIAGAFDMYLLYLYSETKKKGD